MSGTKEGCLLEYKEECFKQTMPYGYEMAYLPDSGLVESTHTGHIIRFPDDDANILNFEGINEEYVVTNLNDETLLVPVGAVVENFHGIVRTNETAAFLIEQLKKDTTEEELVAALLKEYDVDRATAEKHVHAVLRKLREIKAITDRKKKDSDYG